MPKSKVVENGAPREVGTSAKGEQLESQAPPKEQQDLPEPEIPEEMESWDLDDVMDLLPTGFD